MPPETQSLLERVGRGDPAAVPLMLDRFGPLVWSIARRQVGVARAEDLVQEIFVQIWKNAGRYDPERASETTYITTIARRRAVDERRKIGRSPESVEIEVDLEEPSDPFAGVELADEARIAADALSQLKPEQQRVLRLTLVEGLTHAEVAAATELPLGTVKSHVRRGLEKVRGLLREDRQERQGARRGEG